ncbi:MAG: MFS transporter, partial [Methanobacteriaceae archaeon]|nr:MFS transporter [Methanobacteriaceae archaeon]
MIKDTRSFALILAFLASFLTPFVGSSINIALPQISQELSINAIVMGWIPTAYLLVLAVLLIPVGRFSDIHGRKKIFWM